MLPAHQSNLKRIKPLVETSGAHTESVSTGPELINTAMSAVQSPFA